MKGEKIDELTDLIDEMYEELISSCGNLTPGMLDCQMRHRMLRDHIGGSYTFEEMEKRKNKERFSFFDESSIRTAIEAFFCNHYNLKRIARECVHLDEDDKFVESMDVGEMLGYFWDSDGKKHKTSILEVTMKLKTWGDRNLITMLPFDIMGFRLLIDEEHQWVRTVEPAKEIDTTHWEQLSIFDFIPA